MALKKKRQSIQNRNVLLASFIMILIVGSSFAAILEYWNRAPKQEKEPQSASTQKDKYDEIQMMPKVGTKNDQPGFDCGKSRNTAEHLICKNSTLASLDVKLNSLYKFARERKMENAGLYEEQLLWLKLRNKCIDEICLLNLYKDRIDELKEVVGRV